MRLGPDDELQLGDTATATLTATAPAPALGPAGMALLATAIGAVAWCVRRR